MSEKIPEKVSAEAKWICDHWVVGVSVECVQTGTDTAETYLTLTTEGGVKARWLESTFRKVATLTLGHNRLALPAPGIREKVEARRKYEKANAEELAQYERLKAKFG